MVQTCDHNEVLNHFICRHKCIWWQSWNRLWSLGFPAFLRNLTCIMLLISERILKIFLMKSLGYNLWLFIQICLVKCHLFWSHHLRRALTLVNVLSLSNLCNTYLKRLGDVIFWVYILWQLWIFKPWGVSLLALTYRRIMRWFFLLNMLKLSFFLYDSISQHDNLLRL